VAPDTLDIIGEFDINGRPLGVAWANDFVYVSNSTTGMVEVYNTAGVEQFVLGAVATPLDMAVGSGNVYVVDGSDRLVKIFTQDGTFVGTIPENGYDRDILANPTAITVDAVNRQIYVSDYGDLGNAGSPISPRVQVFDYDGLFSSTINAGTGNTYRFTMPQGLTINGNNQLFVVDSFSGRILIYDAATGALLRKMKRTGRVGKSRMRLPLDLVIAPSTRDVFVTNNRMASIKVFAGAGGVR
jgi:DNA-binding beta-propeller fold protein YncE